MRRYAARISYIALSVLLFGCGTKKDETTTQTGSSVTAAFLTASDFTSTKETEITATDLPEEVDGLNLAKNSTNDSSTNTIGVAISKCMEGALSLQAKDTIVAGVDVDIANCVNSSLTASGNTTTRFAKLKQKVFIKLQCEGGDLSALSGKKLSEIEGASQSNPCASATQKSMVSNLVAEMIGTYQINGQSVEVAHKLVTATMMADANACTASRVDNVWTRTDGCIEWSHTKMTISDTATEELSKLTSSGIKTLNDNTSRYPSAGSYTVYLNGWTGALTFIDANTAPTWSLTKGADTQTGTFGSTQSLLHLNENVEISYKNISKKLGF